MPPDTTPSTPGDDLDFGLTNLDIGQTLRGLRAGMKVFGRYELEGELGRGGMGVVWRARDGRLDLEVALKFLPEALAHDETAVDDLRRETQRSMKLGHTHIVKVYDLVEEGGAAAIVMEQVKGKTLAKLRLEKAARVFEVGEIRGWVGQVCEALGYAHEEGRMVHRDMKPSNVMVTERGQVKVMDFGIASSLGDSMSRVSKVVAGGQGTGGGTLPYMSPQQLLGYPASVGDDVYGLGAMIYELLTGKPPFYSGSIERQIESITPPSMVERRRELKVEGSGPIPETWERVVAACLEKESGKRPRSVREVWEGLSGVQVVEAVSGKRAKKGPGAGAGRKGLAAVGAGVLVLAGLGWWGLGGGKGSGVAEPVAVAKEPVPKVVAEGQVKVSANLAGAEVALQEEKIPEQKLASEIAEAKRLGKERAYADEKQRLADEKERQYLAEQARLPKEGVDFKSSSGMLLKWVAPLRAWVGVTEVTQDEFLGVMGTNPSTIRGGSLPVNAVTWNESQQFCQMLTAQDTTEFGAGFNFSYRLPSDSDYSVYVEGSKLSDSITSVGGTRSRPAAAASGAANIYGLYDVRGNVWEWLADRFDRSMNNASTNSRLASGLATQGRVLRGGSFTTSDETKLDINTRASDREGQRDETCGFRVILRSGR